MPNVIYTHAVGSKPLSLSVKFASIKEAHDVLSPERGRVFILLGFDAIVGGECVVHLRPGNGCAEFVDMPELTGKLVPVYRDESGEWQRAEA